jgi:hypothetical protein
VCMMSEKSKLIFKKSKGASLHVDRRRRIGFSPRSVPAAARSAARPCAIPSRHAGSSRWRPPTYGRPSLRPRRAGDRSLDRLRGCMGEAIGDRRCVRRTHMARRTRPPERTHGRPLRRAPERRRKPAGAFFRAARQNRQPVENFAPTALGPALACIPSRNGISTQRPPAGPAGLQQALGPPSPLRT